MGEDKGSRFNRWYKEVKGEGIPGYLKSNGGKCGEGWLDSDWETK